MHNLGGGAEQQVPCRAHSPGSQDNEVTSRLAGVLHDRLCNRPAEHACVKLNAGHVERQFRALEGQGALLLVVALAWSSLTAILIRGSGK